MSIEIAHGAHKDPTGPKCAGEWRYVLCNCSKCTEAKERGKKLTDTPPCSPASVARVIPIINDRLTNEGRQRLASRIPLIPSLAPDADASIVIRVERRVALWVARSVEYLSTDPRVKACNDALERWLAGELMDDELAWAEAEAAEAAAAEEA